MLEIKAKFDVEVGLSDHTIGNTAAVTAAALGACAIEKHFTLSRSDKGPDSAFSIEPSELRDLILQVNEAWKSLGAKGFARPAIESSNMMFRRSLYFVKNIAQNEVITHEHVRRIRPGYGLPPKFYDEVIGKKVNKNAIKGDPVTKEILT